MNFKNDASWNMDNKCLIFAEHQSTINENMCALPDRGILKEYLMRKGNEVYNMLKAEYDYIRV